MDSDERGRFNLLRHELGQAAIAHGVNLCGDALTAVADAAEAELSSLRMERDRLQAAAQEVIAADDAWCASQGESAVAANQFTDALARLRAALPQPVTREAEETENG